MLPLQLTLPKLKTQDSRLECSSEAEEAAKSSHWWSAIRAEFAAALLLRASLQASKHLNRLDCFKTRGSTTASMAEQSATVSTISAVSDFYHLTFVFSSMLYFVL